MNELKIFENEQFGKVRAIKINEEPWFVGKDVAAALGYGDTDQALRRHVDGEDKLTRNFNGSGQNRNMTIGTAVTASEASGIAKKMGLHMFRPGSRHRRRLIFSLMQWKMVRRRMRLSSSWA